MSDNKLTRTMQGKRRKLLGLLYDMLGEGETETGSRSLAELFGDPDLGYDRIAVYARDFESMGILRRRIKYGDATDPGKHSFWSLPLPRAEGFAILDRVDNEELAGKRVMPKKQKSNGVAKTEALALAPERSAEETRAIAGPDAPSPFAGLAPLRRDESFALVEAARQYKTRTKTIDGKLAELAKTAADLGINIDMSVVSEAITVEADERLEHVGLVLPYIDRLENQIAILSGSISEYKAKVKELDDLRVESRKLRQQNERLIAAKAEATAHPN